ncbi:MAG: heavy-metal-associated domain-containing protein [Microgenomates group bacterium]|nr:heavy-metal-associated domain-containing protein [Candidatus Woesebacteria bacterium]MBP6883072.1 heavy-metal-associated domain-containing protein [Candidatus Woesebacteria bacterium]
MRTQRFKIDGMHCSSCAMNIDGELEDTKGVKESKTSYAKMITEVVYDESLISDKKIIEIVKNIGYSASTT